MKSFEARESATVGWARYDPATETMEVDFKDKTGAKASTYSYAGVSLAEWERFERAESKGKHFAFEIRPKYKGVKK